MTESLDPWTTVTVLPPLTGSIVEWFMSVCCIGGIILTSLSAVIYVSVWKRYPVVYHERVLFLITSIAFIPCPIAYLAMQRVVVDPEGGYIVYITNCSQISIFGGTWLSLTSIFVAISYRYWFRMKFAQLVSTPTNLKTAFLKKNKIISLMTKSPSRTRWFSSYKPVLWYVSIILVLTFAMVSYAFFVEPNRFSLVDGGAPCLISSPSIPYICLVLLLQGILIIWLSVSASGRQDAFGLRASLTQMTIFALTCLAAWVVGVIVDNTVVPLAWDGLVPSISDEAEFEKVTFSYFTLGLGLFLCPLSFFRRSIGTSDMKRQNAIDIEAEQLMINLRRNPVMKVLTDEEMGPVFVKYTVTEFCVENAAFLQQAEHVMVALAERPAEGCLQKEAETSREKIFSLLEKLDNQFVRVDSEYEINISDQLKRNFREVFETGITAHRHDFETTTVKASYDDEQSTSHSYDNVTSTAGSSTMASVNAEVAEDKLSSSTATIVTPAAPTTSAYMDTSDATSKLLDTASTRYTSAWNEACDNILSIIHAQCKEALKLLQSTYFRFMRTSDYKRLEDRFNKAQAELHIQESRYTDNARRKHSRARTASVSTHNSTGNGNSKSSGNRRLPIASSGGDAGAVSRLSVEKSNVRARRQSVASGNGGVGSSIGWTSHASEEDDLEMTSLSLASKVDSTDESDGDILNDTDDIANSV